MTTEIFIGGHKIGPDHPVYIVAEIGINHNGDVELARKLIDVAVAAECSAVKFQKRTPELCVPKAERDKTRETPWGLMNYMDYRKRIEFGEAEYRKIDAHCQKVGITWFASAWDVESVDFLEAFSPPCHKVASACLTDDALLNRLVATGRPVILSTGMSSMDEIRHAVSLLGTERLIINHSTSSYPCLPEELNLNMIATLRESFDCPIGYSGHEIGLQTTYAAVALEACLVERHITLDHHMWGSDQDASVESMGLFRLVRDIRVIEKAMGDGVKRIYETELPVRNRLRQVK